MTSTRLTYTIFTFMIFAMTKPVISQAEDPEPTDSNQYYSADSLSVSAGDSQAVKRGELSFEKFRFRRDSLMHRIARDSMAIDRIVTHRELMNYYHGDFADLLWNISGFYVHDPGSFGKPITASADGLGPEHLTVWYDGIPVREPERSWLNLNMISLESIDRVEVFRCPAGPGAVINIVPKYPKDAQALTTIKFRSIFSEYQDVGAFFGRKIGERTLLTLGGSHRKTPGEQRFQEISGGYLTSLQETRYKGSAIFLRMQYLISPRWQAGYDYQTQDEKYDAYGSNINGEKRSYRFRTPNGLRKDERKDHQLRLDYTGENNYFSSSAGHTAVKRTSRNFRKDFIPVTYKPKMTTGRAEYGHIFGKHHIRFSAGLNVYTIDSLPGIKKNTHDYTIEISDQIRLGEHTLRANVSRTGHSEYTDQFNAALSATLLLSRSMTGNLSGGITHRYPSLFDALRDTAVSVTAASRPERIHSMRASLKMRDAFHADFVGVGLFANAIDRMIIHRPLHFLSDTMKVQSENAGRMRNAGADLEVVRSYRFLTFRFHQSLMWGKTESRRGIPSYRAHLTGQAERSFFNKNLHLNGYVSVKYFGRHPGYGYQDAPMRYYTTPRNSKGGWLFNARVVATIGDLKIFYEAENIFRARFTLLDGYNVTPQQWRFGLIWDLYN